MVYISEVNKRKALILNNTISLLFDSNGNLIGTDVPVSLEYIPKIRRVSVVSVLYDIRTGVYEVGFDSCNACTFRRFRCAVTNNTLIEMLRVAGKFQYFFNRQFELDGNKYRQALFVYDSYIQDIFIYNILKTANSEVI